MSATHRVEYIEFVTRLRQARKVKGLTQPQMAALLKKPQSYVSKIETCERRIDPIEAALWCRAVGVTIEEMLPDMLKTVSDADLVEEERAVISGLPEEETH
ncbi:hypothetical protein IAD21_01266 [Abditibacteriota bacterium]|nr:hypothetical protein IAD21_01266 [Abditibacteriota bacterium]